MDAEGRSSAAFLFLTGCTSVDQHSPAIRNGKGTAHNHTADYIHQFYVDGSWGGNVYAYSGGASFVCCVQYPGQWRSNLEVKVRWTTSSSGPNAKGDAAAGRWHEANVSVERYDRLGIVHVHFLAGGHVRGGHFRVRCCAARVCGASFSMTPSRWPLSRTSNPHHLAYCINRSIIPFHTDRYKTSHHGPPPQIQRTGRPDRRPGRLLGARL
ncbi:DUF3304 domain-containing protein [Cupriavidus necator]|uniref:DUF3304 domain-containing protein n=1 Tax=Cupriavidus necator TaxID=106590 RepID=UPI00339D9E63